MVNYVVNWFKLLVLKLLKCNNVKILIINIEYYFTMSNCDI
jgi:hypothetical protein